MEDSKKYSKQFLSTLEFLEKRYIERLNSEVKIRNILSHNFYLTVEDIDFIIKLIKEHEKI